jgi:adenine-specific DNA-methyltransferase
VEKDGNFKDVISEKDGNFNILIEGDNYHSLSVLKYTHRNKIDVIYIDPPYNTGNQDFIYNDNFVDKENTFRHSRWLSFMNKRLDIAKDLLKDDGVIFISIDDNEQAQLKLLCDQIFKQENYINTFTWVNNLKGRQISNIGASQTYEYILCYSKNFSSVPVFTGKSSQLKIAMPEVYKIKDYEVREDEHGEYVVKNELYNTNSFFNEETRPNLVYNIYYNENDSSVLFSDTEKNLKKKGYIKIEPKINNNGTHKYHAWRWGREKVERETYNLVFTKYKNTYKIYSKVRDVDQTTLKDIIVGYPTSSGGSLLKNILGKKVFDYPKPLDLIKLLLNQEFYKDAYVLDFMAGSGTTGHAVLKLNKDDGGNRKFILCTNNENNICEKVTYERIKRVSQGYKNKKGEKVEGLGGNLKYLKTDFIKIDNSIDDLKEKIVEASTQILCLKESTFKEHQIQEKIKIYESSNQYTAILFDTFYLKEFTEVLNKLTDKKVSVYVFAYDKNFSKEEFHNLSQAVEYTVEPIPEKLLETYQEIFNF